MTSLQASNDGHVEVGRVVDRKLSNVIQICVVGLAYSVSIAGGRDCAREGFLATASKSKVNGLTVVTDGHIFSEFTSLLGASWRRAQ